MTDYWRLPEGIDEVLPPRARELEQTRRRVLDVFDTWGYEYVEPPLIERLDGLLVGSAEDMEQQMFKLTDPESGETLALRPEMTSQALRIDSHSLAQESGPQRLCYAGPVARSQRSMPLSTRVPYLAGAELFGASELAADAEIISLLAEVLQVGGVSRPLLVLGHAGIVRALLRSATSDERQQRLLYNAIQDKSESDINALDTGGEGERLVALTRLMGRSDVLARASEELGSDVRGALADLQSLCEELGSRLPDVDVFFDLAEVAAYGYHTGVVFAAYGNERGQPLARGGRYDGLGGKFGRIRPATGFDLDLKQLPLGHGHHRAIFAPTGSEPSLLTAIADLRGRGERVVQALSTNQDVPALCDRRLLPDGDAWIVADHES